MRLLLHKPCLFQHRELSVQRDLRTFAADAMLEKSSKNNVFSKFLELCGRFEQNRKQAAKKPKTAQMRAQSRRKSSDETTSTEKRQASPNLAKVEPLNGPKLAPTWRQVESKLPRSWLICSQVAGSLDVWCKAAAEPSAPQRNSAQTSGTQRELLPVVS